MRDLADLIAPLDVDTFFAEHWERAPLHAQSGRGIDATVLSTADVEAVIAATPIDGPDESAHGAVAAAVTIDGQTVRESLATDATGQVAPAAVYGALDAGKSIVIRHLRRSWPQISTLCARVEAALGQPVSANMFLTPAHAAGYPDHADSADTFFCQLEGSKTWTIHEPQVSLPCDAPPDPDATALGAARVFRLEPGDVLFLPRGWIHSGVAGDVPSLHVTLAVMPIRWVDVLHACLDRAAATDVELRRAVPVRTWLTGENSIEEGVRQLHARAQPTAADDVLAELLAGVIDGLPSPISARVADVLARASIDDDTVVALRPGLGPLVRIADERASIHLSGALLSGPAEAGPAMAYIARQRVVRVGSIPLDARGRRALAQALVLEGMAEIRSSG